MSDHLIYTTKGELPADSLLHREVVQDFEDATVTAQEYYLGEELVRRDVHVALKGKELPMAQASF